MGIGMPMNNMGMDMGMNNLGRMGGIEGMGGMNGMQNNMNMADNNDDYLQGFKLGAEEILDDRDYKGPKMNITFTTITGIKHSFIMNYGTTIDQALKKYLYAIGKPELINSDKISFLFNANKLEFGNNETIEKFFKNIVNPKIVVN